MDCATCRRMQADGFRDDIQCRGIESVGRCPSGDLPYLSKNNREFWSLFTRILPGLIDGFGGFNYQAIEFQFNIWQVDEMQRPIIMDKCLVFIKVLTEQRRKKKEQSGTES